MLGRRIRNLRDARKWSLKRLSANCGVSIAAIQKIEAGAANPSLLTVIAIIEVLGESVDQLISASRKLDRTVNVVRGTLDLKSSGYTDLSARLGQQRMNCQLTALAAREHVDSDDLPTGGPLFGYVLDGGLRLSFEENDALQLTTGDSFHITADTAVEWSNPLSRRSLILCIADRGTSSGPARSEESR
jgi:transcriptional regulator with XRE-family HTH domain